MITTLKPCPFCGSDRIALIKPGYWSEDDWVAKCDECGTNVSDSSEERIVQKWNRRYAE